MVTWYKVCCKSDGTPARPHLQKGRCPTLAPQYELRKLRHRRLLRPNLAYTVDNFKNVALLLSVEIFDLCHAPDETVFRQSHPFRFIVDDMKEFLQRTRWSYSLRMQALSILTSHPIVDTPLIDNRRWRFFGAVWSKIQSLDLDAFTCLYQQCLRSAGSLVRNETLTSRYFETIATNF